MSEQTEFTAASESAITKNEDTKKPIQEAAKKLGQEKLKEYVKDLESWKNTEVKIAFIGQSGSGKSTKINQLRKLTSWDKKKKDSEGKMLFAPVGNMQTTTEIAEYEFPKNKFIKLYDLPGAGTKEFPIKGYPQKIKMDKYDAFILLTKDRFYENDKIISKVYLRDLY